jgi:hypothetical protein
MEYSREFDQREFVGRTRPTETIFFFVAKAGRLKRQRHELEPYKRSCELPLDKLRIGKCCPEHVVTAWSSKLPSPAVVESKPPK